MIDSKKIVLIACMVGFGTVCAKVTHISNEEEYAKALKSSDRLIVKFYADWCSVCSGIQKPFDEIASEPEFDHVNFVQVDVDKLDSVSKQNGIVGVPTFVYVENGAKKIEEIGVQNMPAFKENLRGSLRKNFNKNGIQDTQKQQPENITIFEEDEVTAPAMPPVAEPNIIVKTLTMIKDFILVIILKIKDFFMMILQAIKGLFS